MRWFGASSLSHQILDDAVATVASATSDEYCISSSTEGDDTGLEDQARDYGEMAAARDIGGHSLEPNPLKRAP